MDGAFSKIHKRAKWRRRAWLAPYCIRRSYVSAGLVGLSAARRRRPPPDTRANRSRRAASCSGAARRTRSLDEKLIPADLRPGPQTPARPARPVGPRCLMETNTGQKYIPTRSRLPSPSLPLSLSLSPSLPLPLSPPPDFLPLQFPCWLMPAIQWPVSA